MTGALARNVTNYGLRPQPRAIFCKRLLINVNPTYKWQKIFKSFYPTFENSVLLKIGLLLYYCSLHGYPSPIISMEYNRWKCTTYSYLNINKCVNLSFLYSIYNAEKWFISDSSAVILMYSWRAYFSRCLCCIIREV